MCTVMVKVYIEFFMKTTVVSYLLSSNRKFIKYKSLKKYSNVKQQQPFCSVFFLELGAKGVGENIFKSQKCLLI